MKIIIIKYLKYISLLVVYFLFITSVFAESTFQIDDIEISLDTKNSINVRNIAIQKAENTGIDLLAQKLLTTDDYRKFSLIKEVDANYLVEGLEFKDEVITSESYKAILNIRFNKKRIREFFQAHSLVFTETKSNEIPLYAVFSNHEEFYNVDKAWRTKWSQRIGKHYALNMSHTLLTREEKNALTLPSFLSLDFIMNNDDFNSDNIILIWCDPKIKGSKIELNIISKIIINNSTKIISNNFIEDFSINEAEYLDDIITNLEDNIYNHWVSSTAHSKSLQSYKFQFNSKDFNEWIEVKTILENIGSISSFYISEVSNNKIEGSLEFFGDSNKLRLILNENNIYASDLGSIHVIQLNND